MQRARWSTQLGTGIEVKQASSAPLCVAKMLPASECQHRGGYVCSRKVLEATAPVWSELTESAERRLIKASSGGKVACMIMQGARLPTNRQEECLPGIGARAHTDDVNIML